MNEPFTPAEDATEVLDLPEGYEMVDGQLVEHQMGARSSWVGGAIHALMFTFCQANRLGYVFPADTAYRCFANRKTVRKPDVSFVARGRLPNEEPPEGEIRIPPDLAVEVVSPNDTVYELDRKVEEYLAAGVRLVWVINPEVRLALIHRLDRSVVKVRDSGELDGEDVVRGFRCPLRAILDARPAIPPGPSGNGGEGQGHR
jgi:Uma2 family endonuclease